MIARTSLVLLLAGWTALPLPWSPHLPAWAERWLYNPRERTERALEAYREGRQEKAVDAANAADIAQRLAPGDPRTGFNAGTAHLAAGHSSKGAKLLEGAAKKAGAELAPPAWYNAGNARLASGDAAAAVEDYKQALLRNPADAEAKFNLELALREREKERLRMQGKRQGSRGDRSGEREQSRKPGEGSPSQREQRSDAQDPGRGSQGGQEQARGQQGPQQQPSPQGGGQLPQFRDQPEMSAREASSLLSAVENLERRQRREAAAKRARQQALKGKDW